MSRSDWAVAAAVPVPRYWLPPGCVSEPKPGVAIPLQHRPMSPLTVVGPVFVIVEPASSANESAVPSATGDAAWAPPASPAVSAKVSVAIADVRRRERERKLGLSWSTIVVLLAAAVRLR